MVSLEGKVCIVTGATRGIGKGIALQLGQAGATVYITGRTLEPKNDGSVGGSLKETACEIESRGGKCIPVKCDHSDQNQIKKLFEQVKSEQNGRLDVLVNNAYSAVTAIMSNIGKPFWEQPDDMWDTVNTVGLRGHFLAAIEAAKLMVPAKQGLIVNVSSAGGLRYLFNVPYGVGKEACDRMAADCAFELRKHNIAFVSIWPGAVQTETLMDKINDFTFDRQIKNAVVNGETIEFPGIAIAHLAADQNIMKKTGRIFLTVDLADEYGFKDINGQVPPSYRRVKDLLKMVNRTWLAACIPGFIKVPFWLISCATHKF
ncbi:dehydrogenase/reductase SDR family member 1-like [Anneissia japonica]|uniref:dehydrogenase/reductase SDR family member 1-like n=1 Tax=Anneissia japonica TaxID=1529436 RepID=UPI0014256CFB|nr:dehydrogenase/reductase SDR family member 1-like [Anneissia japonica]